MLEIDPQLRGQADAQPEAQEEPASTDSYLYPKSQISPDAAVTESEHAALAQALTSEELPYYDAQLSNLPNATTPTYQPIHFVAHEARKRPRSCESCRGLKVKCEPNETGTGPCKRCAKAGRECLYTESSGRRKKKEDNKVKELEQKVNGLTAALLAQRGAAASESLVFGGEDSLLLNGSTDSNGLTRKRRHSQTDEEDGDLGVPRKVRLRSNDIHDVVNDFCTSLKTIEVWVKQRSSQSESSAMEIDNPSLANGFSSQGPAKAKSTSNGLPEGTGDASKSAKSAPKAQMARTPLDLLSQVASNEQSTPAQSAQSDWYNPFASTTQDPSALDGSKQEEATTATIADNIAGLDNVLRAGVGERADLVLEFLKSFTAKAGTGQDLEDE